MVYPEGTSPLSGISCLSVYTQTILESMWFFLMESAL